MFAQTVPVSEVSFAVWTGHRFDGSVHSFDMALQSSGSGIEFEAGGAVVISRNCVTRNALHSAKCHLSVYSKLTAQFLRVGSNFDRQACYFIAEMMTLHCFSVFSL